PGDRGRGDPHGARRAGVPRCGRVTRRDRHLGARRSAHPGARRAGPRPWLSSSSRSTWRAGVRPWISRRGFRVFAGPRSAPYCTCARDRHWCASSPPAACACSSISNGTTFRASWRGRSRRRGVVASGHELALLRETLGPDPWIVVPGVRAPGDPADDQARTIAVAAAVGGGATHLVVGRPITRAADPRGVYQRLMESL